MASLSLRKLDKSYGSHRIVKELDLDVADGEFVVLVGPSGCGKSTTLRMIAGLESASGGEIRIGERCVNALPPRSRDIAMVFQDYALYPHKTVEQNMAFGLKVRGVSRQEAARRVAQAAQMLGIGHLLDRRPAQLSGGQRQRVAMGRAIVRRPQIFLFDEPLSNLDAKLRSEVRTEIKHLHQEIKTTIVYVTHDQVEAMTPADRIVILRDGRIEQVGTPDEVYNRPSTVFVGGFIGAPAMNFTRGRIDRNQLLFSDGNSIPLIALPPHTGAALEGRDVIVGIRPEHLSLPTGGLSFTVVVKLAEPLGSDTLVHFKLGDAVITARMPPYFRASPGQKVEIEIDPAKVQLFDISSERSLM